MRFLRWTKREFFHLLPVFLFFAIAFTVINWTEKFLFELAGLTPYSFIEILIAAALVAKVFLVIDYLPWIDLFRKMPLFYRIVWKTLFYWLIVMIVRIAIRLVPFLFSGEGLQFDLSSFFSRMNWKLFFSIQADYLMLLFIFTTARDATLLIGADKMRKIFFGTK